MSELEIHIGGRSFMVACQPGEEQFLISAAAMLDAEAQPLVDQMGRLPEARMLLMAALMLADKTASYEDELQQLRSAALDKKTKAALEPAVQIAVIPPHVPEALAEIAARAEALAAQIEDMV